MPSIHLFRAAVYASTCLATISLWMGEDDPLPYPWAVIFCAVAAHAFTDRWEKLFVSAVLAPWLGIAALCLLVAEEYRDFRIDPVLPLGHFLVYLQVLFFFHRKKPVYYWYMLIMSFLELVISA